VKPHASPIFHAIQYLLGQQSRNKLENFRSLDGAQAYPSRTKDSDDVDFSTGSVGLGVAMTSFTSLVQDYIHAHQWGHNSDGRMIALVGDGELDEGNIYEALLEGWKHDLRNTWWVIDYNRQSLDGVVTEGLRERIDDIFSSMGWQVVTIKYGHKLTAAFAQPGGDRLRQWIDECPNDLYAALCFQGGSAWREHLNRDLADSPPTIAIIKQCDDDQLAELMTNLGGWLGTKTITPVL
jgi:pyruvate dehydrogenase E1 component